MICSKCGNEVSDGSRFCTYCAASLDADGSVSDTVDVTGTGTPPQTPAQAVGSVPSPDSTPPGSVPPGSPSPGTPPGAMPPSGSPPPYVVATPMPPAVEPKKSKAPLVVGIVVGVVLLCCICCAVVAWLIYAAADDVVTPAYSYNQVVPVTPPPTAPPTPAPPSTTVTPPPDLQDQPRPPATVEEMGNPKVIIDNDTVKVTIDAGTRIVSDAGNFIDVFCLVENKTDQTISLVFQEGAYTVDGYKGGILIIDKDYEASEYGAKPHFLPGETAPAALAFDRDRITGDLKNLNGTLLIYNAESLEDIAAYSIEVPEF